MKKIFFILLVFSCAVSFSQPQQYSSSSKKAIGAFEKAMDLFNQRKDEQAERELKKSTEIDPNFIEAWSVMGDIFSEKRQTQKAIEAYQKAVEINPAFFPANFNSLAEEQLKLGMYADAAKNLKTFLTYKTTNLQLVERAKQNLKNALFAEKEILNPVPFNPINLSSSVNSRFEEYLPTITADEQTLIVTVRAPKDTTKEMAADNQLYEDFYESKFENGTWKKRTNIGPPINSYGNEGAQSISPDGQMLFFTSCAEVTGDYADGRKGLGSCDIFYSIKIGNKWSKPRNIGAPINSKYWESQPCISPDGTTLYFVSNRTGGKGKEDIYYSKLTNDGTWGTPVNLGDSINTNGSDISPFIHPDNETFYFSSDGQIGFGKKDIFFCKRKSDGTFSSPKNIGYPINTWGEESAIIVSANGKHAYYDSERKEGLGMTDIYSFDLYEAARPLAVTFVKGKVYNSETKKEEEATIELIDLKTQKVITQAFSNPGNGEYLVCLPIDKNYAFNVSKNGYLFYSENFSLKGVSGNESFKVDIPLKPIKAGETAILKNVFFNTASFELLPDSKVELMKLVDFMQKNPSLRIEVSGHTDNVGDKQKNLELSEARAKSVMQFLIENKIVATRLSFKGFGDTKPIDSNDTAQGKANNRRTEFKIL